MLRVVPEVETDTHARGGDRATPTRSSGSRSPRRAEAIDRLGAAGLGRPAAASTCTSARSSSTSRPTARRSRRSPGSGAFPAYDLGGGLAVRLHAPSTGTPSVDEWVAGVAGAAHELLDARETELVDRARPRARRQRRRDALHGRVGQAPRLDLGGGRRRHVRQPAPDALRRALHGRRRRPPRLRGRARRALPPGRQALRVGRRDRLGRAPARPAARATSSSRPPRAPTGTRWPTTTTACRGRRSSSARAARRGWRAARDTGGPGCPRRLRSACSATARSARPSRRCWPSAPTRSSRSPARGPELSGVLTRSRGVVRGDPRGLGPDRRADGRARAGARLRAAGDAGGQARRVGQQAAALPHGEELWATAREHGVQLRFEGAVAGVVPVIRVLQESLAGARIERVHGIVNGTTNYILTEMAADGHHLRRGARPGAGARLRRGRPDRRRHRQGRGGQDGDPRAAGVLDARAPRPGPLRGHRADHRRRHGLRARPRPRAEADRHRRARSAAGINVRVHPAFLYAEHPLASVHGPFNAVTVESDAITEITLSGPGAGGPQTASAVLGDVISAMIPPATTPETTEELPFVDRRLVRLLPPPRGRRPPRRARPGRRDPRHAGRVGEVGASSRAWATTRGS